MKLVVTRGSRPLGDGIFLLHVCFYKEVFILPIKIADGLDAVSELKKEGIVTIGEKRARTQDIRPLHILILNLMPIKKPTEVQLLRLLGDTPLQLDVDFARIASRETTHTDRSTWMKITSPLMILRTGNMMALSLPGRRWKNAL